MPTDNNAAASSSSDVLSNIRFSSPIVSSQPNVYDVTAAKAEEYLSLIRNDLQTNKKYTDLVDEDGFIKSKLADELMHIPIDVDIDAVFSRNKQGEITGVTSDRTRLQVVIAKTLTDEVKRKALLPSDLWRLNWSEETVGMDDDRNNIKKIGNLFWKEANPMGRRSEQPVLKDLKGRFHEVAPRQWHRILEQYATSLRQANPTPADINSRVLFFRQYFLEPKYPSPLLATLSPVLLENLPRADITSFLDQLGYDPAIAYAEKHSLATTRWWRKNGNPFTGLLTRYNNNNQLARFPVALLADMPSNKLSLFFEQLGYEQATQYADAEAHRAWFKGLGSNPFASLLEKYTSEQLVKFPSRLLRNMNSGDLCTFFKRLGSERSVDYIAPNKNVDWFEALNKEILYSIIENKAIEDITLKRLSLAAITFQLEENEWTGHNDKMGRLLRQFVQDAEPNNNHNKDMVDFLLEQREINLWVTEGNSRITTLHFAMQKKHDALVLSLLRKIIPTQIPLHDTERVQLLNIAIEHNNERILKELLKAGIKDFKGSALITAIKKRQPLLVKMLSDPRWHFRTTIQDEFNIYQQALLEAEANNGENSSDESKAILRDIQHQKEHFEKLLKSTKNVAPLSDGSGEPLLTFRGVKRWQQVKVTARSDGGNTRFDGQLIIQLEDNLAVREAAANLAGKHPERSVLVQLDAYGNHRVYGDPAVLKGKLRWQLVGHGRGGKDDTPHITLGGYPPEVLAAHLASFSKNFMPKLTINGARSHNEVQYVSLVGCSLTDQMHQEGYAKPFALSLAQRGINADIALRSTQVAVTVQGQKLTHSREGVWGHKINDNKLILSWNNQGELVPADDLAVRLTRAISLVDALAGSEIPLSSLDASEQAVLADFFPQTEGKQLDINQLVMTVSDDMNYALWRQEAHQLLQLQDTHSQLKGLNGKEALQHSRDWNESLVESMVALSGIETKNRVPGVMVKTQIAPQEIYIGNRAPSSLDYAKAVGLAWLNARSLGPSEAQQFFNGLMVHGLINEQKAEGALSEGDTRQIKHLSDAFDQLKRPKLENSTIFTRQSTSAFDDVPGDYLLKAHHHVLMLSSRRAENGQYHYRLYDPHVGEMQVSGTDANKVSITLQTILHDYLEGKTYRLAKENPTRAAQYGTTLNEAGQYRFEVYKVNLDQARTELSALNNLPALLSNYQSEFQRLATAPDVLLGQVTLSARTLSEMGARIDGKPLASTHLNQANVVSRLRFDPEQLSRYLSQADSTDATAHVLRFLKQQIITLGAEESLLAVHRDRTATTTAAHLLQGINQYVDVDQGLISAEVWPVLHRASQIPGLQHLNQFSTRVGNWMQGYGYTRGLYDLLKYAKLAQRNDLSDDEKQALSSQRNWAIASFVSNAAIDISQYGLGKSGEALAHMAKTHTGWAASRSRLGKLRFNAASGAARFVGPMLSIFSAGFDIRSAYLAFSALANTTDDKARQDLIVEGSLSAVGAAMGIGTGLAFMLGGKAAMVAGPAGVVIGIGLMLVGEMYSAVRQIEEIKKYVDLSAWEELENGWRIFTGQGTTPEVLNRTAYTQTQKEAREEYDRWLKKVASRILRADSKIDRVYYSPGQLVPPQDYFYQEIVVKDTAGVEHVIKDGIHTTEEAKKLIPAALAEFIEKREKLALTTPMNLRFSLTGEPWVRNSQLKYFIPKELAGTDDTVDANLNSGNTVLAPFIGEYQQVGKQVGKLVEENTPTLNGELDVSHRDYRVVMGDFNGDKHADIGYFASSGFYLLSGDGKGGYGEAQLIDGVQSQHRSEGGDPFRPRRLVGDVDNDGRDDIIVITIDNNTTLHILLAQPDGSFSAREQTLPHRLPDRSEPTPLLADIDGDGCADLVSLIDTTLHVNYGTGDGQFSTENSAVLSPSQLHQLWARPQSDVHLVHLMAGDIDGDGYKDDVILFTASGDFYTLQGNKNRKQQFSAILAPAQHNSSVAAVFSSGSSCGFSYAQLQLHNMNADGYADLVVIKHDGQYSIAYGRGDGTFDPEQHNTQEDEKEENGRQVAYRPNILAKHGQQAILGIAKGSDGHNALLSLNQAGELTAHTFQSTRYSDTVVMFRLGEGDDVAQGHRERKNSFEVHGGTKKFTGGYCADSFLLMGKPAPDKPSVLDGGKKNTGPFLLKLFDSLLGTEFSSRLSPPLNDNDMVIAADKPTGGEGYHINLRRGNVKYVKPYSHSDDDDNNNNDDDDDDKLITELRNIEHAQGHNETNDCLIGDERNNYLNGAGGNDHIFGHGGNDILTLQAGYAEGGTGTDTYRILQNTGTEGVSISLKEAANTPEISNILLDYNVAQIVSIALNEHDVRITLLNDNLTHTALTLMNVYSEAHQGNLRKRQSSYILYTRDGMMITGWPEVLNQPRERQHSDEYERFPVKLSAFYDHDIDRTWTQRMPASQPEKIIIHQRLSGGHIDLTVPQENHMAVSPWIHLPSFITLTMAGTRFNDYLEGDENNNKFESSLGNDEFVGKGGVDHYFIDPKNAGKEIVIDNEDSAALPAQDRLFFPFPVQQISLQQDKNDIVLRHSNASVLATQIRIKNFMMGERYRHLSLMDDSGRLHKLTLNNQNKPSLGEQIQATEGNDMITLSPVSQVTDNQVASLAGDDMLIDKSGDNHTLLGGDGNDILVGGKGNDALFGGKGDDLYLFEKGDGLDSISDVEGNDCLEFSGITKEQLFFIEDNNHLHIYIKGDAVVTEGVVIKEYYAPSAQKIEAIEVAGYQLTGEGIDQLVTAMSGFTFMDSVSSWQNDPTVVQSINQAWKPYLSKAL